jgi:hypothetical protein
MQPQPSCNTQRTASTPTFLTAFLENVVIVPVSKVVDDLIYRQCSSLNLPWNDERLLVQLVGTDKLG